MKKFLSCAITALAVLALAVPAFAELQTSSKLDVEGVKVTPLNASVKVEWDAVDYTDGTLKGYVVWADTKPAAENGDGYTIRFPGETDGDLGNVTTYTVTGLTNGTKYYFAVTAVDTNGVESQNWSVPGDVSTTPTADAAGATDTEPPQVTSAESLNKVEVKIVFSEAVVLPVEHPENSFVVQNTDNFEDLVVSGAKLDATDTTNKTVIITTDTQTKDANYKLTVGIDVEDVAGNPIRSDSSATAPFKGTDTEKVVPDTTAPEVSTVEVVDNTHVMINFSEGIVLGVDPTVNFTVTEKADTTKTLAVTEAVLGKNTDGVDDASVVLTTASQSATDYVVTVTGIKDIAGNDVAAAKSTGEFTGVAVAGDGGDGTVVASPKDVASFLAKKVFDTDKWNVTLTWKVPTENVGVSVSQLLYRSIDKGANYTSEATLDSAIAEYEIAGLDPGTYWFKLTQKDAAGTETTGKIIKLYLAKTGPEMLGLLFGALILGKIVSKKKKK